MDRVEEIISGIKLDSVKTALANVNTRADLEAALADLEAALADFEITPEVCFGRIQQNDAFLEARDEVSRISEVALKDIPTLEDDPFGDRYTGLHGLRSETLEIEGGKVHIYYIQADTDMLNRLRPKAGAFYEELYSCAMSIDQQVVGVYLFTEPTTLEEALGGSEYTTKDEKPESYYDKNEEGHGSETIVLTVFEGAEGVLYEVTESRVGVDGNDESSRLVFVPASDGPLAIRVGVTDDISRVEIIDLIGDL